MLARSLPPSSARPPLSPPHTHTGSDAHPASPSAAQARPLKGTRTGRASAASRRSRSCRATPGGGGSAGQIVPAASRNNKRRTPSGEGAATPPSGPPRRRGLRRDPAQPRAVGWQRRGNGPSPPGLDPSCPAAWEDLLVRSSGVHRGGVKGPPPGPPSSEVPGCRASRASRPSLYFSSSLSLPLASSSPPPQQVWKRSQARDSPGDRAPWTRAPPPRLLLGLLPPPQLCKAAAPVFRGALKGLGTDVLVQGC